MASQIYEFHMEMTCEGCANAAKRVLGKKGDAVTSVETDVGEKKVTVTSTLSQDELLEALQKTGKEGENYNPRPSIMAGFEVGGWLDGLRPIG